MDRSLQGGNDSRPVAEQERGSGEEIIEGIAVDVAQHFPQVFSRRKRSKMSMAVPMDTFRLKTTSSAIGIKKKN